jgi:hypothetical protein
VGVLSGLAIVLLSVHGLMLVPLISTAIAGIATLYELVPAEDGGLWSDGRWMQLARQEERAGVTILEFKPEEEPSPARDTSGSFGPPE